MSHNGVSGFGSYALSKESYRSTCPCSFTNVSGFNKSLNPNRESKSLSIFGFAPRYSASTPFAHFDGVPKVLINCSPR
jgi:hypothetical protein